MHFEILSTYTPISFQQKTEHLTEAKNGRFQLQYLPPNQCVTNAETMESTDDLSSDTVEYFQQRGIYATKVSDVIGGEDQKVNQAIQEGIDRVNAKANSTAQRIQKWTMLGKDFSVSGGELGEYHHGGINCYV